MKCDLCHGEYRKKQITRSYNRRGSTVVIDDIPALVCDQCGDVLLKETTVRAIQELLGKDPTDTAPLYHFPHEASITT